jgi:tetratricopeptide (TPR) repeat protein
VQIDPDRPQRLHALAQAYEGVGRNGAAVDRLYQRALELQPALAWIRADYGDFLQAQGRRDEAEEAYRGALREQPSLAIVAFNLGTVLTEQGRLDEASETFRKAVHLNPALAEALAPLFYIRTMGNVVTGARTLGSPLPTLPVRYRGPDAVQVTMGAGGSLRFANLLPRTSVRILKPNGTLIRTLPAQEGPSASWDLRSDTGNLVGSGVYRAEVRGREDAGRTIPPQRFFFGIVRVRVG